MEIRSAAASVMKVRLRWKDAEGTWEESLAALDWRKR
jgi:hypothetical protein